MFSGRHAFSTHALHTFVLYGFVATSAHFATVSPCCYANLNWCLLQLFGRTLSTTDTSACRCRLPSPFHHTLPAVTFHGFTRCTVLLLLPRVVLMRTRCARRCRQYLNALLVCPPTRTAASFAHPPDTYRIPLPPPFTRTIHRDAVPCCITVSPPFPVSVRLPTAGFLPVTPVDAYVAWFVACAHPHAGLLTRLRYRVSRYVPHGERQIRFLDATVTRTDSAVFLFLPCFCTV